MSVNMFDALSDEPVAASKAAAASSTASSKTTTKPVVGGAKKTDAPRRDVASSSSQSTTKGSLPGEVRKDVNRGPRKQHAPRTDQEGKMRGREYDRHSGTGRPAGENKRGGAGRGNWGSVKDARDDEEAAVLSAVEPTEGAVVATDAAPVTEGAAAAAAATTETTETAKVETEPEIKTQSLSSYRAEKAKKDKEFEAALGLAPATEVRVIAPAWYKPAEKSSAPVAASSSKAAAAAAKEQKQVKNYVPISQVIGEKPQLREERRGPRPERREGSSYTSSSSSAPSERREGGNREGGQREGGQRREGGNREGGQREGGQRREGGNREGGQRREGGNNQKGGKNVNRKTFDATADADSLPALGQ